MSGAAFTTFVEGPPVPKGRPRVTRNGHAYTPARTVAWEETVAWNTRNAMDGRAPFQGPLQVELTFYGGRANADLDNLCKAVLDAMNKVVYEDDKQIVTLIARRGGSEKSTYLLHYGKGVDISVWPALVPEQHKKRGA